MKKLINRPDDTVKEALAGVALAHGDRLRVETSPAYIVRADPPVPGKGRWEHPPAMRKARVMRVILKLCFQKDAEVGDERVEGLFVSKLVPFVENALCAQGVEGALVHGRAERLVPVYLALLVDP